MLPTPDKRDATLNDTLADTAATDASIADGEKRPQRPQLIWGVLVSAAILTAAFPPIDLGFLAWIGLAPLFLVLPKAARPRNALLMGYLFGLMHWGATIIWIGTTVSNWVHSPIGWVAWVLLTAIKSWWFALFGFLAWHIGHKTSGHARTLGIACAWTVVEWCRGQTGIAMPWSLVGYTQYRHLPVIQCVDIGGVYLISFAIAYVSSCVSEVLRHEKGISIRGRMRFAAPAAALVVAMLLYGMFTVNVDNGGQTVRLAVMQPNLRSERFASATVESDLSSFQSLAEKVPVGGVDLMVWPETVAPQDAEEDSESRSFFSAMARRHRAYLLVGTSHEDERQRLHNSAALFTPDGELSGRYDKRWLVPMGEWVPMRNILPFGDVFHFPRETYPGTSNAPLTAGPVKMSVLICYESVFPVLSRIGVQDGANLLVNITNDSWAGESSELAQHLAMTAFRAVETRRSMVSSATTGVTCVVEPDGRIHALPPYKTGVLTRDVTLRNSRTIYVIFGDTFVGVCALIGGIILVRHGRS